MTPWRRYARIATPEEFADLAHLRRARDLIDREYARPLDVAALTSVPGCIARDLTRPSHQPSRIGETPGALAP